MAGTWAQLVLVAVLVLINAVFSGSEIALISLRDSQVRRLEQRGGPGRLAARLARDPNQLLSTVQIGITLAGFLASAVAAVSLAQPLVGALGFLGNLARPVAIVLVTVLLTFITLVLGELAPKRLALQRPEAWALRTGRALAAVAAATRPVVWLLSASTDLVVRMAGGDPHAGRQEVTQQDVRDLVASTATVPPAQREILTGAFDLTRRRLRDVVVPRREVIAFPADTPAGQALRTLIETTHSRAPVYEGDLDHVLGMVLIRDLVDTAGTVREHVRPVLVLPESMRVLQALQRLQAERQQLAVVINEYGGSEGIVTLEDLLEELVGEIYDEFDTDSRAIVRQPDGSFTLPGSYPVHDLPDLGLALPAGDYATIAGLVLDRLGRLATPGDAVEVDGWRLEVRSVENRAITEVRLTPSAPSPGRPPPAEPDGEG
jgi:putative hemolysin